MSSEELMTENNKQTKAQIAANRKAARKTAVILAVVAFSVFAYSVYMVFYHANK